MHPRSVRRPLVALAACWLGLGMTAASAAATTIPETPPDSSEAPSEPTGEPVKVMVMGALESQVLSIPQIVDGVMAGAAAVNASGGIAGHPVEVISCNDQADPNEAAACARQAVDEDVIAAVGTLSIMADAMVPILEEAGIAMVGTSAITPLETTSPIAFPTAGGILVSYSGIPVLLNQQTGAETIGIIHLDTDSGRRSAGFVQSSIDNLGLTVGNVVAIPDGATDVAPQVTAAIDGADGLAIVLAPQDLAKVLGALAGMEVDLPVATNDGALPAALVESLGPAAEGVFISGAVPPVTSLDAPGIAEYVADSEAAGVAPDSLAADRWVAMRVLQAAMEGAETVDAATVLERMGQIDCLTLAWLDCFTTTEEADIDGYNRIFNFNAYFSQVQDGVITYIDGPVRIEP